MADNFPDMPELPRLKTKPQEESAEQKEIKELKDYITNIEFFSDARKFNYAVYGALNTILEKLGKIEESLNKGAN